jgi:hypothetical protein
MLFRNVYFVHEPGLSQKPEIYNFTPSTIYCKGGKLFKIALSRQPHPAFARTPFDTGFT